jgi:hypothetical protein
MISPDKRDVNKWITRSMEAKAHTISTIFLLVFSLFCGMIKYQFFDFQSVPSFIVSAFIMYCIWFTVCMTIFAWVDKGDKQ